MRGVAYGGAGSGQAWRVRWNALVPTLFLVLLLCASLTVGPTTGRAQTAPAQSAQTSAPAAPPPSKSFFLWTDTSLSLLPYGWRYTVDPSRQSTITIEHAHESTIGDFFGFVDLTWFHNTPSGAEWFNWYGELSPRISVGKLLDKDLSFNLFQRSLFEFKDVLFAAQYERGRHPSQAEALLLGIGIDLDVREAGLLGRLGKFKYIQLNFYARSELTKTQQNGFRDMQITLVAAYPFAIGEAKFLIDGYFDWVLGLGSEQSSFHLNPQIKLDVGNFWGTPDKFYVGIELDFWWNKYQIRDTSAFRTNQQAASLLMKMHF